MRIKISAPTDSTTPRDFWYVVDDKAVQHDTVHDLKKKINATLPMAAKARYLNLTLEGFQLLAISPLNGLIRDGDTIKIQYDASKLKNKKTILVPTPYSTLASRSKPNTEKPKKKVDTTSTKTKPEKRKRKEQPQPQSTVNTNAKRQKKDKLNKQPDTKDTAPATTTTTTAITASKSKARNLRRAKNRQAQREKRLEAVAAANAPQSEESSTGPISATTTLTHSVPPTRTNHKHKHDVVDDDESPKELSSKTHVEPPRHLIKHNKNKKKDFLKQMDRKPQSQHIMFDEGSAKDDRMEEGEDEDEAMVMMNEQVEPNNDDETNDQPFYDITNTHGGAFITESESQQVRNNGKKQRNYMNRQYPVDELEPVFLAVDEQEEDEKVAKDDTSSSSDSDSDSSSSDSDSSSSDSDSDSSSSGGEAEEDEKVDTLLAEELPHIEKVDYEQYPVITLQGPHAPIVGDHLAIKTLHLSESYTPEISDWKEIKVVKLTSEEMVVEYIGQANTFSLDVQRGRLRKFDLPPEHEQEDDGDLKNSINYQNLLEMRRILK